MKFNATEIPVTLKESKYNIVIGAEGLNNIDREIEKLGKTKGAKILVVTNDEIGKLYLEDFINRLKQFGFKISVVVIKSGEAQKTIKTIELIHNEAFKAKLERGSIMIALGGGVVGDMTGFAASTWLRGISVIQVPTTLLAMVDASIGGKTGVNHPGGKNLIGAFHQPKLVLIDPNTLKSLPSREFKAGMAEVIKYGVISDPKILDIIDSILLPGDQNSWEDSVLFEIIKRSVLTKARIVELDEKEGGIRATLNYGHTFGHVIETLSGYGTWLHGEAVAMGMNAIGGIALQRGCWSEQDFLRQKHLINKTQLPSKWPEINTNKILEALDSDKKVKDGKIRFILPRCLGKVEIVNDITKEEIKKYFSNLED